MGNIELEEEEEEEFVLLDLDGVCMPHDITPNVPYVLSGLDTMNPMLVLGDKLKLIGEYQETIGTCFVFSESDSSQGMHKEIRHSTSDIHNSDKGKDTGGSDVSEKQVKPIARLHKILKFRLFHEDSDEGAEAEAEACDLEVESSRPTNPASQIDGSMPATGTEGLEIDAQHEANLLTGGANENADG